MELSKTYADNSSVVKTYDSFNRLATETDVRGIVMTHSYEPARGLLLGTTYSDTTTPRSYAYNHLGQLTQVTDAAGVRTLGYNHYGEQETDSLLAGGKTHLITETRDAMGRSTGYVYSKDGSTQCNWFSIPQWARIHRVNSSSRGLIVSERAHRRYVCILTCNRGGSPLIVRGYLCKKYCV